MPAHESDISAPIVRMVGDSALLIEFGNRLSDEINNAVISFDAELRRVALPGIVETAPTIRSVLVCFDPMEIFGQ